MTIRELCEIAQSIHALDAEIRVDMYDDTDAYMGDTNNINLNFAYEDGKQVVYLEAKY